MMCIVCQIVIHDVLNHDFRNWNKAEDEFARSTLKFHSIHELDHSINAGCEVCHLVKAARERHRPKQQIHFQEKWKAKSSIIDVHTHGHTGSTAFTLFTPGPSRDRIAFELFDPVKVAIQQMDLHKLTLNGTARVIPDSPLSCPLPTDSRDPSRWKLASYWLDQCLNKHEQCRFSRSDKTPLPKRVIDVGTADGSSKLRLVETRRKQGRYITLSYCWGHNEGPRPKFLLSRRNISRYKQEIPLEMLPATLRDAIFIVRRLGERYLWVDCLCIIQGDQDDWITEAANMSSIFQNSLFCLSAIDSSHNDHGILLQQPKDSTEVDLHEQGHSVGVRSKPPDLQTTLANSPLTQRAWCFQERILAPAILHVAKHQLFWECAEGSVSESDPSHDRSIAQCPDQYQDGRLLKDGESQIRVAQFERVFNSGSPRNVMTSSWYRMIEAYSTRELTYESDRVTAILGLANKVVISQMHLKRFMFGLWEEDIPNGLMWQVAWLRPTQPVFRRNGKYAPPPAPAHVPSWSWASVPAHVVWIRQPEVIAHRTSTPLDASISYTAPPASTSKRNSHAQENIRHHLDVTGHVKRGIFRTTTPNNSPRRPSIESSKSPHSGCFSPGRSATAQTLLCELDCPDVPVINCYALRLADLSDKTARGRLKSTWIVYLLLDRVVDDIVQAQKHTLCFRRIGIGCDEKVKVDRVFAGTDKQDIALY